jgi:hypothetical protein
MRFDWNSFPGEWFFDYHPNVINKPYVGVPNITSPQREATITGTIAKHVLQCEEDYEVLRTWFADGSKLVRCPVFHKTPIIAGDFGMGMVFLPSGKLSINWDYQNVLRPYQFSSFYLTGVDITGTGSLNPMFDPALPHEFLLNIRPVNRGFDYQKKGNFYHIEPIEFFVVPWVGYRL